MFETEISNAYSTALFVFVSFFPVLNAIGGAMFFLTLTNGVDSASRAQLANRIAIYSIIVLFVSMYAGNIILNFFGISIATLRVAGGIVLFGAGWQALNAPSQEKCESSVFDGVLSVHIAFDDRSGGYFGGRGCRCHTGKRRR